MDLETLLKNTSRSLYLSVQALPRAMRPAFSVAYLLCRYADTIADTSILPPERRLYWITRFPTLIEKQPAEEINQLAREIAGGSENPYEKILIGQLPACLQAFNRISEEQKPFVLEVARAVCEGMKIDLQVFTHEPNAPVKAFQTEQDLAHYCRLMGGKPGLFWSQLIYQTSDIPTDKETFFELGQHIGDALQIVNILRDLPKDLQIGRCYFPEEDLQKYDLSPADLVNTQNSLRFEPVKQKWILWGLKKLQKAPQFFRLLPKTHPGQRAAVAWPVLWAADTLYKLWQESDLLNPAKRVKISRGKIYLTLLLTPPLWLSNAAFSAWLQHKLARFGLEKSVFSDGKI
ncbi:MAG: squalene/phytoene synthase family protein [Elusimicrobiaceae bacterium]|nr:squalene/phytoene synthase family protein [Elusimicrobiaceae bacterium]